MSERMLTVDEVCERVQLGRDAVRRAIRAGELRACKLGGRYRIEPRALDAWLEATQVTAALAQPASPRRVRENLHDYRLAS